MVECRPLAFVFLFIDDFVCVVHFRIDFLAPTALSEVDSVVECRPLAFTFLFIDDFICIVHYRIDFFSLTTY